MATIFQSNATSDYAFKLRIIKGCTQKHNKHSTALVSQSPRKLRNQTERVTGYQLAIGLTSEKEEAAAVP